MEEPATPQPAEDQLSYWDEHRFMLLIILTLVISVVLVSVSLIIYNVSGSAQLDLSRPGNESVIDKVDKPDTTTDYSAFGPVNKATVDEFTKMYDEQAKKAKAVDAFNGDPLNPEVLEFSDPATSTE